MYHAVEIGSPLVSPRGDLEPSAGIYTLVFPVLERERTRSSPRMTFGAACELLRASIPVNATSSSGSDEKRAIADLKKVWMTKFRAASPLPNDSVPSNLLFGLLRELVIARFEGIEGLQVISTPSDGHILVHLHPSPELLATTAEKMKLPVPIMREIDPGSQYWNSEESRQREKQLWERPAAQEELYRLFLAGKIPAEDARLFDEDEGEDMGMWSRRIHALYRFSDPAVVEILQSSSSSSPLDEMLPPKMETVTYLPFANRASLHYLYRQIDGAASSSSFRHVDKIRITRAIVDEQFNIDTLVTNGVLLGHFCAHSHHTDAIDTSIEALQSQWGDMVGSFHICRRLPEASRWSLLHMIVLVWRLPAFQPLQHIRNYFGEQIALYFEFASCFALKLQNLLALSLFLNLLERTATIPASISVDDMSLIVFAVANCVVARTFERRWIFKEKNLAAAWGTNHDFAASTHDRRPLFKGRLQRSDIDHRFAPYYSPRRRLIKQIVTSGILLVLIAVLLGAYLMLVTSLRFHQFATSSRLNVSLSNVIIAVISRCLASPLITQIVEMLTEWENHETHESHEAALTLKYALAQSANAFSVLGYYSFARKSSDDCNRKQTRMTCQEQVADLLEISLALDLVLALLFAFNSNIFGKIKSRVAHLRHRSSTKSYKPLEGPRKRGSGSSHDKLRTPLRVSRTACSSSVEFEVFMPQYGGVLDAYARLVLPFGYVAGFALLAPLVSTTLAWATTLTHLRMDAFTLTHSVQRPFPNSRTSIGSWQSVLGLFSLVSAASNAAFVAHALSSDTSDSFSSSEASIEIQEETTQLAVYTAFAFLWWVLGLSNHWDRTDQKRLTFSSTRSEFLRRKYLSNMTGSKVVDLAAILPSTGRVFLNGVFRFLVTGDKLEEDAADELYDQTRVQQRRGLEVEARIAELRATSGPSGQVALVGSLNVEALGINLLPPGVGVFIELQLIHTRQARNTAAGKESGSAAAGDGASFNTSVSKRDGWSAQWRESFEIPINSLEHVLELRVVDATVPMLGSKRGRKRLGVAKVSVVDIIDRCLGTGLDSPTRGGGNLVPAATSGDEVVMASYNLPLDVPDAYLAAIRRAEGGGLMHGHPRITLRCGVRLEELGTLLVAQRKQQRRLAELRAREARFLSWEM